MDNAPGDVCFFSHPALSQRSSVSAMGGKRTLFLLNAFVRTRWFPVIIEMDQPADFQLVDPQLADPSITNSEPANYDRAHGDRPNGQRTKRCGYQSKSSDADGSRGGRSCRRRARSNGLTFYPGRPPSCCDRRGSG